MVHFNLRQISMVYRTSKHVPLRLSIFFVIAISLSLGNALGDDCTAVDRAQSSSRQGPNPYEKAQTAIAEWSISNRLEWTLDRHGTPFRYDDNKQNLVRASYCHTNSFCVDVERTQTKQSGKSKSKSAEQLIEIALKKWVADRKKGVEILDGTFKVTQKLPWAHQNFPGLQVIARRKFNDDGSDVEVRSYFFADGSTVYRINANFDASDMATYGEWFQTWTTFVDEFKSADVNQLAARKAAGCRIEEEGDEVEEVKEVSIAIQNKILENIYDGKKFDCPRPFEVHGLIHPPELVRRGITGKAFVAVTVDAQKEPLQAWIAQSSGYRAMDANAVWGACGMRYSSWQGSSLMVPITFALDD
jgi:TonB family protein